MRFQKLFYFIVYVQFCLPKGSFRFQLTHTFIIMYFYFSFLVYYLILSFKKLLWTCARCLGELLHTCVLVSQKKTFFKIPVPQERSLKILEIKILNAICCDLCRDTTKNNPLDYYGIPLAMMLDFKCNEMKQWNEAAACCSYVAFQHWSLILKHSKYCPRAIAGPSEPGGRGAIFHTNNSVQCVELKLRWRFCVHGSTSPEM